MTEQEYRSIVNRQYRLPWQLERARERLCELRDEQAWTAINADDRVTHSERRWRLPAMIDFQARKVEAYENEARRYGMHYLLSAEQPEAPRGF